MAERSLGSVVRSGDILPGKHKDGCDGVAKRVGGSLKCACWARQDAKA